MSASWLVEDRDQFERHRYCAYCGRRLRFAQVTSGHVQSMTKVCSAYTEAGGIANEHDYFEHLHPFPYRNRRGQLSAGTKADLA